MHAVHMLSLCVHYDLYDREPVDYLIFLTEIRNPGVCDVAVHHAEDVLGPASVVCHPLLELVLPRLLVDDVALKLGEGGQQVAGNSGSSG